MRSIGATTRAAPSEIAARGIRDDGRRLVLRDGFRAGPRHRQQALRAVAAHARQHGAGRTRPRSARRIATAHPRWAGARNRIAGPQLDAWRGRSANAHVAMIARRAM
jgi:hypothetical protein